MNITLFANINIDSEIRLMHMKDSFLSFQNSSVINQYLINLRGKFAKEAASFLEISKKNDITIFFIESSKGWFYDTQELLNFVSNNTIFLWVEDHICLDLDFFDLVLSDLIKYKIDYLQYSFWLNGLLLHQYSDIEMKESDTMYFFEHNQVTHLNFKKRYINSLVGIYSKKLFSKIIFRKDFVQLWPTNVPFDFERPSWDTSILPFIRGVSKKEIFASIDDCQDVPGSSLIGRGIYTKSIGRLSTAFSEKSTIIKLNIMLRKRLRPIKKFYLFLICSFNTPVNFFFDYFSSIYLPNNKLDQNIPWMNYKVVNYLITENLVKGKNIFEYGSGTSTRFWLKMGAKEVVSVEHDEDFYESNAKDLTQVCNYVLAKPEIFCEVNNPNYFDSDVDKGYSFEKYVNYINNYENEYFDIIIIDGRARNACLGNCLAKLRNGGFIIFDNSNRERYAASIKSLSDWPSKYFLGSVRGLLSLEQTQIIFKN
jgi:hypothetical protein